jgi:hypothetical protein
MSETWMWLIGLVGAILFFCRSRGFGIAPSSAAMDAIEDDCLYWLDLAVVDLDLRRFRGRPCRAFLLALLPDL